jgi:hypothetical protein
MPNARMWVVLEERTDSVATRGEWRQERSHRGRAQMRIYPVSLEEIVVEDDPRGGNEQRQGPPWSAQWARTFGGKLQCNLDSLGFLVMPMT